MNQSNSAAGKRTKFRDHGGGRFPWCQKIGSFAPLGSLSGFWLHKILLDRPEQKIFPAKTKISVATQSAPAALRVGDGRRCLIFFCLTIKSMFNGEMYS